MSFYRYNLFAAIMDEKDGLAGKIKSITDYLTVISIKMDIF
jgi:hypothetical protein